LRITWHYMCSLWNCIPNTTSKSYG
jgi:hypothetical protein